MVHGPEQTLCLGFIGGFPEVQGTLKVYVKSYAFIHCSRGQEEGRA